MPINYLLSSILSVPEELLETLESTMTRHGFVATRARIESENAHRIRLALSDLRIVATMPQEARNALAQKVLEHEKELLSFIGISYENFDFEKIAEAARSITTEDKGFFLKKEYAKQILTKRPPEHILEHLHYNSIEELLEHEDIGEVFSALRFTETEEWMHTTFQKVYTKFTPDNFEHRSIELRVLGEQWKEIAKKYVAKKHHNVSHLKEFGIIFLNPIAEQEPGKFLRDFALLLHYFHEIAFYSRLFEQYANTSEFSERFISLLRGDVPEIKEAKPGEWLIVQRYLWKLNPEDKRLFLPRVNPEAMHWRRAQEDLVEFGKIHKESGLEFWDKLWTAAAVWGNDIVSFGMEDNAMHVASRSDGKQETFFYHQREALWNDMFAEYIGGKDHIEEYIVKNMGTGIISL